MMSKTLTCLLVLLVAQLATMTMAAPLAKRQGPNTIYNDYPSFQTAYTNGSISVIPIPRALAQTLVGRRTLLRPTGLPAGFLKDDEHILTISSLFQTDLRQKAVVELRIDLLATLKTSIPFIDAAEDGKTPFTYDLSAYVPELIPSLGGLALGFEDRWAHFEPEKTAYSQIGDNQYSLQVSTALANPIDGTAALTPIVQNRFSKTSKGKLSARHFKALLTQPILRSNGRCDAFTLIFDSPSSKPFFATADIQTGSLVTRKPMSFKNVEAWYSGYQWAYPGGFGDDCKKVAQNSTQKA